MLGFLPVQLCPQPPEQASAENAHRRRQDIRAPGLAPARTGCGTWWDRQPPQVSACRGPLEAHGEGSFVPGVRPHLWIENSGSEPEAGGGARVQWRKGIQALGAGG